MEKLRKCNTCLVTKPLKTFEKMYSKKGTPCHRRQCRSCYSKIRNEKANKNPLTFLRRNFIQLRSARKKKGQKVWDLDWCDVKEKWEKCKGHCQVSGTEMTHHRDGTGKKIYTNVSIDRINNDIGYNKENTRLVCWGVNAMKHSMSDAEMMLWVSRIYDTSKS